MNFEPKTTLERVARRLHAATTVNRECSSWDRLSWENHMYWIGVAMEVRQMFEYEGTEHDPLMEGKKPTKNDHLLHVIDNQLLYQCAKEAAAIHEYEFSRTSQDVQQMWIDSTRIALIKAGHIVDEYKLIKTDSVPEKKEQEHAVKLGAALKDVEFEHPPIEYLYENLSPESAKLLQEGFESTLRGEIEPVPDHVFLKPWLGRRMWLAIKKFFLLPTTSMSKWWNKDWS